MPTACSPSRSSALAFALPGILPEQTRLLLDREARLAILLSLNSSELIPTLSSFPLTPSATRVLFSLLQAYPDHCSHRTLFSALFPLTQQSEEEERIWEKSLALRPIRRALAALAPTLRAFGLRVVALRGQGYLLAAAPQPVDGSGRMALGDGAARTGYVRVERQGEKLSRRTDTSDLRSGIKEGGH